MTANHLVTLAIHTYRYALELKRKLKAAGIESELHSIFPESTGPEPGVRVCVDISDLARALRVVETEADRDLATLSARLAGIRPTLLIPVDFSDHSLKAIDVGFDLADRLNLTPILLYAYVSPYFQGAMNTVDPEIDNTQFQDSGIELTLSQQATVEMNRLKSHIRRRMSEGSLPKLSFQTEVREGVPEEVILQFSRKTPPSFIVMATRGASRRSRELVGSVTAEVLDSCRVPLFIVPEHHSIPSIRAINKIVFFCNLDQQDILAMDAFQRMFSYPEDAQIFLVSANERAFSIENKLRSLAKYFADNYLNSKFEVFPLDVNSDFRTKFEEEMVKRNAQLIVVPNRRRNIFQRLFNPSVAHRILFEKDIPMIALPSN